MSQGARSTGCTTAAPVATPSKSTELIDTELTSLVGSVNKLTAALEQERRQVAEDRAKLQQEREEYETMKRRVEDVNLMTKTKVKVNVGGTVYESTRETLTAERGSMLEALFSGRHVVDVDETGCPFIDRDSTHFPVILSYLRDVSAGKKHTPLAAMPGSDASAVLAEANFYGLCGLEKLVVASTSLTVSHDGTAKYTTIRAALEDARPGEVILVQAGVYFESLHISKHVEIIGDAKKREDVVVCYTGDHVVTSVTDKGLLKNLTIQQQGEEHHCIFITQGCICVDGCDMSSTGWACVGVSGERAHPYFTNNRISASADNGIIILNRGKGVIDNNDITGYTLQGIEIREEGNPIVRGNHIHGGKDSGVYINTKGRGWIEGNYIYDNGFNGMAVKFEGMPKCVRNNKIFSNKQRGIMVARDSVIDVESDNNVYNNELADIYYE